MNFIQNEIQNFIKYSVPDISKWSTENLGGEHFQVIKASTNDSESASLIGLAFDYYARIETAKHSGINLKQFCNFKAEEAIVKLWNNKYRQLCRAVMNRYNWSLAVIDEYIRGNESQKHKLAEICLFLAKMEHYARGDGLSKDMLDSSRKDITSDIETLVGAYDEYVLDSIKERSNIVFNPKFKCYSMADGDLAIGNTLIDFKTSRRTDNIDGHLEQIWKYMLLSKIDNMNGVKTLDISKITLYYARFARTISYEACGSEVMEHAKNLRDILNKYSKCLNMCRK